MDRINIGARKYLSKSAHFVRLRFIRYKGSSGGAGIGFLAVAATCSVSIQTLLDVNRDIEIVTRKVPNAVTAGLVAGLKAISRLHRNFARQFAQFKVSWNIVSPCLGVTTMRAAAML